MASLELRSNRYRIVFRFAGGKFQTPLKTTDAKEAKACLSRLEENLRLVERGRLIPPPDAELGTFLLSDGKISKKPTLTEVLTLETLVGEYMAVHSNGALEKNTLETRAMHLRHLTQTLGSAFSLKQLKVIDLQSQATAETVEELPTRFHALVSAHLEPSAAELIDLIDRAMHSAASLEETGAFARSLGMERGVTGYMYHTVPVVLHAWLRHPREFRAAIMGVLACGGDTDTTCAITGSIVGAGRAGLPEDWLANLWEWPCGVAWIERVAARLAESVDHHQPLAAVPTNVPLLVFRNGLFACIVLTHGFRRLFPPYE